MDTSDRLREIASDNKLNLNEFSDRVGVQYRTLMRYTSEGREPSADFLRRLTDEFDISASWVLSGVGPKCLTARHDKSDSAFVSIQRFDIAASAGSGALAETEIGTGHYAFNRSWLDRRGLLPDNLAVIAVRGDSMEPELYDKDLILLDQTQKEPRDGDMYVVRYSDELFVKRIQKIPDQRFELCSTNRHYRPIEIRPDASTDLEFIGKVVASMHEW